MPAHEYENDRCPEFGSVCSDGVIYSERDVHNKKLMCMVVLPGTTKLHNQVACRIICIRAEVIFMKHLPQYNNREKTSQKAITTQILFKRRRPSCNNIRRVQKAVKYHDQYEQRPYT